jgi:hypothetical protein
MAHNHAGAGTGTSPAASKGDQVLNENYDALETKLWRAHGAGLAWDRIVAELESFTGQLHAATTTKKLDTSRKEVEPLLEYLRTLESEHGVQFSAGELGDTLLPLTMHAARAADADLHPRQWRQVAHELNQRAS